MKEKNMKETKKERKYDETFPFKTTAEERKMIYELAEVIAWHGYPIWASNSPIVKFAALICYKH